MPRLYGSPTRWPFSASLAASIVVALSLVTAPQAWATTAYAPAGLCKEGLAATLLPSGEIQPLETTGDCIAALQRGEDVLLIFFGDFSTFQLMGFTVDLSGNVDELMLRNSGPPGCVFTGYITDLEGNVLASVAAGSGETARAPVEGLLYAYFPGKAVHLYTSNLGGMGAGGEGVCF